MTNDKFASKAQRISFWFSVFASYLLILFSFDLLARLRFLSQVMGDRGMMVSIAGTMIGLMGLALIMAVVAALFTWRDKLLLWLGSLMFFGLVLVGAVNCVRLFWISLFTPPNSYIILLVLVGLIYLAIMFLLGTKAVAELIFSKIVVPLKYLIIIIILAGLVLGLNLISQNDRSGTAKQSNRPNVVLITVDNLPDNRLSWEATPNLWRLARNSYNFTNASACYPWARSNIVAIFNSSASLQEINRNPLFLLRRAGLFPLAVLPPQVAFYLPASLIKQFGDVIYANQTSNGLLTIFGNYDRFMRRRLRANTYLNGFWEGYFSDLNFFRETETFPHVREIIKDEKSRPLFLWIHEPGPSNLDYLKINELDEKSLIIVLGINGPRVPLIVHLPGQKSGQTIAASANIIDVVPTILELLDIPRPDWVKGKPLKIDPLFFDHQRPL